MQIANKVCKLIRDIYSEEFVQLHRPVFTQLEEKKISECIATNYVSSVGEYVNLFEENISKFVGAKRGIACVNGTSALHASLMAVGVRDNTQVITQALSFVATANAIKYCHAEPVFIDVDIDTLGMSPTALKSWLESNVTVEAGSAVNKRTGQIISCCVPMHTFGLPCRIEEISELCREYRIPLVEDAAESLGSKWGKRYTGTFGSAAIFSFNGNKIITTGGGGMIVTNNDKLADFLKHLTTTAKKTHSYEYYHDEIGYNYRMPNINAAIGCAQMEIIGEILNRKGTVAKIYNDFFNDQSITFIKPVNGATSNHWLNAIVLNSRKERDEFLKITNDAGVMTRPIWALLSELPMYRSYQNDGLRNSKWLSDRVVNIPSSVPRLD